MSGLMKGVGRSSMLKSNYSINIYCLIINFHDRLSFMSIVTDDDIRKALSPIHTIVFAVRIF